MLRVAAFGELIVALPAATLPPLGSCCAIDNVGVSTSAVAATTATILRERDPLL